jgi:peptidoglycan/xylan/chitin deacetylase (PgdA/CDA1 family)
MNTLTIVMYHYVRPIANSKYPRIKGLELKAFKRQLDYLSNKYNFITAEELLNFSLKQSELPTNPCYLTFDDGFKDHIKYVVPELLSRGIQGSFFPPSEAVENREMLDVHALHFILACSNDNYGLIDYIDKSYLEHNGTQLSLNNLKKTWLTSSRYDTAEIMFIKNMLQHALPSTFRSEIVSKLFKKYVGISKSDFSDELYISMSDAKKLVEVGMYVGNHGHKHVWLDKESKSNQMIEISSSLNFLKNIGAPTQDWIMCYPFGGYNKDTLNILKLKKCQIGLTTNPGIAQLNRSKLLELSRFDTNDFPK